jgi:two-component system chemotaxis response regulator CheY
MHALVVDDSKAMRAVLRHVLKELGFEVLEAGNGLEGLERLRHNREIQLALVDWNMPEMDGFDFICALRADPTCNHTCVLMVTTETDLSRVSDALAAGADEYLMKPFTKEALLGKLGLMGISPC